jgi:hypothetical protein
MKESDIGSLCQIGGQMKESDIVDWFIPLVKVRHKNSNAYSNLSAVFNFFCSVGRLITKEEDSSARMCTYSRMLFEGCPPSIIICLLFP